LNLLRRKLDDAFRGLGGLPFRVPGLAFFVRLPFGMFVARIGGRGGVSVHQCRQPKPACRGDDCNGGHGTVEARFILLH
jgi:hypothetical protein